MLQNAIKKAEHIVDALCLHEKLSKTEKDLHSRFDELIRPRPKEFYQGMFSHFGTAVVNLIDARTLLHPVQDVEHLTTDMQEKFIHGQHLTDAVLGFFISILNSKLADMNAKTVVFGSLFYAQLCDAIERDDLRDTGGVTNHLQRLLKRYNYKTEIKDIERIIIVMHQAFPTRSLRPSTEKQRKVNNTSNNMSNESTFNVENGHYYFVACSLLPSTTGELKLKEYDSSTNLGSDRLKIVSKNLEKYFSFLFETFFAERATHDAICVQAESAVCRQQEDWWNCGLFAIVNLFDVALDIEPICHINPSHIRKKLMACLMKYIKLPDGSSKDQSVHHCPENPSLPPAKGMTGGKNVPCLPPLPDKTEKNSAQDEDCDKKQKM